MNLARVRKATVATVGLAAVLATQLPPDAPEALQRWAPVIIGAATALGVYRVPNAQPLTREALKEQTRGPRTGNPLGNPPPPDRPKSRIYQRRPPPPRG
jgi:hypothetical protein